jgi:RNA polymerase sigma factor (sigma-70 family)
MHEVVREPWLMAQQDQRISEAIDREYAGLRKFIRRRVPDQSDAEDILQDVFYELVEAYRMMKPIEQVTAWLFRVARNRIIDRFRRTRRQDTRSVSANIADDDTGFQLEDLLPSPDAGPEATFFRNLLLEELDTALDDLPEEQREVFVAHEWMGYSFNEISAQSGVPVNTLLSRKRYAVRHLRRRLHEIYQEFRKP